MIKIRRSDREIKNFVDIISIIDKCDVCRIALNSNGYPYILPLNFGYTVENGSLELYFHGADQGTKFDLIKADNRASFEMDCEHRLIADEAHGSCTMSYESVIGQGRIKIIGAEERVHALRILMSHYHQEPFPFHLKTVERTTVFKLEVEHITGKMLKIK